DPASARRAQAEAGPTDGTTNGDARVRLPVLGVSASTLEHLALPERVAQAGASRFAVRAPSLERALEALAGFDGVEEVELELADYGGLALEGDRLAGGARLVKATAATPAQA